jgi:hypothetical protein
VRLAGAAFDRDDLIASHGPDHLLTDLRDELASPTCSKVGHHWNSLRLLKHRNPHSEVKVKDLQSGEVIVVTYKPET